MSSAEPKHSPLRERLDQVVGDMIDELGQRDTALHVVDALMGALVSPGRSGAANMRHPAQAGTAVRAAVILAEARWGAIFARAEALKMAMAVKTPGRPHWAQVLEISPLASPEEIRAAYRKKAALAHPDAGGSVEVMSELNAARDAALKAQG